MTSECISDSSLGPVPGLYRTIVEQCADAIIVIDRDQRVRYANGSALEMFGWDKDTLVGLPLDVLLPARFRGAHGAHVRGFGESPEAARFMGERDRPLLGLRADGAEFPVDVSIVKSAGEDGPYFVAILRDITDAKRQEEEMRHMVISAQAASLAKSAFVANMSHEIRTPLNAVIGMAQVLAGTDLSGRQQEFLKTIEEAGEHLLSVLNDVLDLSAIESGVADPDIGDVQVTALLEKIRALWAPRADAKGLELTVRCAPSVPSTVRTDGTRLRQILSNLISNAIKFTTVGGILITAEAVDVRPGGAVLRIDVRDSGIGMTAEQAQAVFGRFVQADDSTRRRHDGAGLGLAICRALVEMLGGEIGVDSCPGEGTTFRVALPVGLSRD